MNKSRAIILAAILNVPFALPVQAMTPSLSIVDHTPFIGPEVDLPGGFSAAQGATRPYDTSMNLAYQGNGFAKPAVSLDNITYYTNFHQAQFANDGLYGNGRSWIGNESSGLEETWIKVDLGRIVSITEIRFGRDRLGYFGDRHPESFSIEYALSDNVYMNGDYSYDDLEYSMIADSGSLGYSGMSRGDTLAVSFDPLLARYIKINVSGVNTAIDEIQVFPVPEPSTYAMMGIGLAAIGFMRRRKNTLAA